LSKLPHYQRRRREFHFSLLASSLAPGMHAFTGVGGFSYLKYKHSKQQQLAQLLIARNEALMPSSLHKMFHLYVQGIPPDSAAGRWAKNNKHFLKEALLCAMHNAAVHNPDKLPECLMTVHPDDAASTPVNLNDMSCAV
jgi:hypothetical protein